MKTKHTEFVKEIYGKGKNSTVSLKMIKCRGRVRDKNTLFLRCSPSEKCGVIIQSRPCRYQNEIT
jgi:hypothetical protein